MGKSQKDKGKRGERAAASLLRRVFPHLASGVRRGWQARFGGKDEADIVGLPFHVEVAIGKNPSPYGKLRQAILDTEGTGKPILVMTKRDHEEWVVTMRFSDFAQISNAVSSGGAP